MKVYVAYDKETGNVVHGARSQSVFADKGTLRKSIGADSWKQSQARKRGVKVKDTYDVFEYILKDGREVK